MTTKRRPGRPKKWHGRSRRLWFITSSVVADAIDQMVEDMQKRSYTPIYRSDVLRTLVIEGLERYGYVQPPQ